MFPPSFIPDRMTSTDSSIKLLFSPVMMQSAGVPEQDQYLSPTLLMSRRRVIVMPLEIAERFSDGATIYTVCPAFFSTEPRICMPSESYPSSFVIRTFIFFNTTRSFLPAGKMPTPQRYALRQRNVLRSRTDENQKYAHIQQVFP